MVTVGRARSNRKKKYCLGWRAECKKTFHAACVGRFVQIVCDIKGQESQAVGRAPPLVATETQDNSHVHK
jgi:hypothetical protein